MPLASSIELPERYRVVGHIASGGMASVWEAEDLLLDRIVAVKVLGAHYAADPDARARFQREARTAAQVSDQTNVVTIYDIGEHGDDAFIVMEHFSGGTVADRLRAARDSGSLVPRDTALRWLREAAAGLDVAHGAGIVHRDVKPANLLLDAQGRLAVADFGIARLADDAPMTQTGQVLGTAAYLSPEQALGQPATDASDRYALAVVAYELLTGTRPFVGGPPSAQARQHAEVQPPPASRAEPDLPPALDRVLARGLAKDPAQRPRSAAELVAAIEAALGEGTAPEPTRRMEPIAPIAPAGRLRPAPPRTSAAPAAGALSGATPPAAAAAAAAAAADAADATPPRATPPAAAAGAPPARTRPEPAAGAAHRRPGSAALLGAALAAVAAIVLALALASAGDDRNPRASDDGTPTTASSGAERTQTAAQPVAAQPPPPPEPQAASPSTLNTRGHTLIKQGRYGEAIEPLRQAVAGYKAAGEDGLPYAYALFNLAVALNRSGNPAEAVPLLRERLKFGDQTQTVQAELDSALAKLGQATPREGKGAGKPKKDKKGDRDDG